MLNTFTRSLVLASLALSTITLQAQEAKVFKAGAATANITPWLGTSLAGMVAHDDLTALAVLRQWCAGPIGVVGFSGGGGRAMHVAALDPQITACAVVGMMSTLAAMLPEHLFGHSWLLNTPGFATALDVPELAAGRRRHAQFVGYGRRDALFPLSGMEAAHTRLTQLFASGPGSYDSEFTDAAHVFEVAMQERVTSFLATALRATPRSATP